MVKNKCHHKELAVLQWNIDCRYWLKLSEGFLYICQSTGKTKNVSQFPDCWPNTLKKHTSSSVSYPLAPQQQDKRILWSLAGDRDSLLDQMLLGRLWTVFSLGPDFDVGASMFLSELSNFSKNPRRFGLAKVLSLSIRITLHNWSGSSHSCVLQVISHHPSLSSARVLLSEVSQNSPLLLMFPLSSFPSTGSYLAPWL